jgi:hypothetical protein
MSFLLRCGEVGHECLEVCRRSAVWSQPNRKESELMKLTKLTSVTLAVLTLGSIAVAQNGTEPKKQEPAAPAKVIPAATRLTRVKADLVIPVTGLTADNAAKLKTTLEGLKSPIYSCAACSEHFAVAGSCPACQASLKEESKAVFSLVTVTPDQSSIKFQTNEGMQVRSSELERTLKASSIMIDNQKLAIPGRATLYVASATTDEQASAIQKALQDGKQFQRVATAIDPTTKQARIYVTAGATAPTRGAIDGVLAKVNPSYKITEVIWNVNTDEAEKK